MLIKLNNLYYCCGEQILTKSNTEKKAKINKAITKIKLQKVENICTKRKLKNIEA